VLFVQFSGNPPDIFSWQKNRSCGCTLSQTDTLISQIDQVIQEIRDIKEPIDSSSINNTTVAKLLKSKGPHAQTEHSTHPRQDISGRDENDGVETCDNK
jgi:hypothetical protein